MAFQRKPSRQRDVDAARQVAIAYRLLELAQSLVDRIGDVLKVDEDHLEPTPETVAPRHRELLLGVFKLDGGLLHVLDVARATAPAVPAG